jgi:hypothetical protein
MTPISPLFLVAAWALCAIAFYHAARTLREKGKARAEAGEAYTGGQRFRDVLLPLGFGLFGLRTLLIGYGWIDPQGWGGRALYLFAAAGFLAGVAASRIKRMD